MKISDEMVTKVLTKYYSSGRVLNGKDEVRRMRAALEAAFYHIADMDKMVELVTDCDQLDNGKAAGLEAELDIVVEQILNATDLDKLKAITRKNFPECVLKDKVVIGAATGSLSSGGQPIIGVHPVKHISGGSKKAESKTDDGWIKHDGQMIPVCGKSRVWVTFGDGEEQIRIANDVYENWFWSGKPEKNDIIAYQILKEENKDSDEWIEWNQKSANCPVDADAMVQIKWHPKLGIDFRKEPWAAQGVRWDNVAAYRIFKEEKKEKFCPECKVNLYQDVCECPTLKDEKGPKKQTLYEFAQGKVGKNIDILTPSEILDLTSEYMKQNSDLTFV